MKDRSEDPLVAVASAQRLTLGHGGMVWFCGLEFAAALLPGALLGEQPATVPKRGERTRVARLREGFALFLEERDDRLGDAEH